MGHCSDSLYEATDSFANSINNGYKPCEERVCTFHSQAHYKYGEYSNKQCTCNSLTFLAFLFENESIAKADLNLILDKGNAMYTEARKRFPNYIHLITDELPDQMTVQSNVYHVNMTVLSRYGTLGNPKPGCVDYFLDLLSAIRSALCIVVDGRFAYCSVQKQKWEVWLL